MVSIGAEGGMIKGLQDKGRECSLGHHRFHLKLFDMFVGNHPVGHHTTFPHLSTTSPPPPQMAVTIQLGGGKEYRPGPSPPHGPSAVIFGATSPVARGAPGANRPSPPCTGRSSPRSASTSSGSTRSRSPSRRRGPRFCSKINISHHASA